jgi:hypothetical protein
MMLLSHFDGPRNLITTLIPKTVLDISVVVEPNGEVILLAIILFLSTIAFKTSPAGQIPFFLENVLYELREIMDRFHFYFYWIFVFMFSIVNDNPSLIRFLLMVFFALGKLSRPVLWKIRFWFMLFNICYLVSQFVVQIGGWDDPATNKHFGLLRYIGFIFGSGKPSLAARNMSIVYQLLVAFVGLINLRDFDRRVPSPRFEAYLPIRIYNAICALLHHCMPLLIQISLCTSTLFNPSIFGWFSYVIMIIVNYVPSVLDNWADLITFLFNICFLIQYLLFLGWPDDIFGGGFNIMNKLPDSYSPEQRRFVLDWLKWAGVYDVTTTALVSNCISAMIFTFYLD